MYAQQTCVLIICCDALLRRICAEGLSSDLTPAYESRLLRPWCSLQRDNLFFPPWAFGLPGSILRLPYSLTEATIYVRTHTVLTLSIAMTLCAVSTHRVSWCRLNAPACSLPADALLQSVLAAVCCDVLRADSYQ